MVTEIMKLTSVKSANLLETVFTDYSSLQVLCSHGELILVVSEHKSSCCLKTNMIQNFLPHFTHFTLIKLSTKLQDNCNEKARTLCYALVYRLIVSNLSGIHGKISCCPKALLIVSHSSKFRIAST